MLLLAVLLSGDVQAGEKTAEDFAVSITLSPVHLIISTVELTGEFKISEKASAAIIGGYGNPLGLSLFEVGGQGRGYLLGDFKTGVSLGGEAMLVRGTQTDSGVRSTASAISVGPFVGGKWTTDIGFTLDSQLGVQYSTLSSTSTSSEGTASSAGEGVGGLFNLNLGWSF